MSFSFARKLFQDDDGQDIVEYALLLAFLSLAAVALLSATGSTLAAFLGGSVNILSSATTASSGGAS